jgi:hypothetical protein
MNTDIAPVAASATEQEAHEQTPTETWAGILLITPDMVEQILDANDLADITEE